MVIIYPVGILQDNSGALLSSATVTIASVQNPTTGAAISSPGATVNTGCLPFISVSYDAAAHGEAVITLSVSQGGHTVTGANASPAVYCALDSSLIDLLPNINPGSVGGLPVLLTGSLLNSNVTEVGGVATSSGILQTADVTAVENAIMSYDIETGVTLKQMLELIGAYAAGNTNPTTDTIDAVGNPSTARITYTVGANGSRTITVTP